MSVDDRGMSLTRWDGQRWTMDVTANGEVVDRPSEPELLAAIGELADRLTAVMRIKSDDHLDGIASDAWSRDFGRGFAEAVRRCHVAAQGDA